MCRYEIFPLQMSKCKWSGCSYRINSYFGLKRHEPRCSLNSVAKLGFVQASTSTSFTAITIQGAATRAEEDRVTRDGNGDKPVLLSELQYENNAGETAGQSCDGYITTDIA